MKSVCIDMRSVVVRAGAAAAAASGASARHYYRHRGIPPLAGEPLREIGDCDTNIVIKYKRILQYRRPMLYYFLIFLSLLPSS
jgi:hypothetical protein